MKESGFSPSEITNHILNNCSQGFLTFGNDCIIQSDFSQQGSKFFDRSFEGKDILEVLFQSFETEKGETRDSASDTDVGMIRGLLEPIFSRTTQLDVLKDFLPDRLNYQNKSYSLTYQYLKSSEDKQFDLILIVFSDITVEMELRRKIEEELDNHGMISRIALDRKGYMLYREELLNTVNQSKDILNGTPNVKDLRIIKQMLQGVQSGAEIYDLKSINSIAMSIEKKIKSMASKSPVPGQNTKNQILEDIELIEDEFNELEEKYLQALISDDGKQGDTILLVTSDRLASLKNKLHENISRLAQLNGSFSDYADQLVRHTDLLFEELAREPIGTFLQRYEILAQNFAERLGKQVEVELIGKEITVPMSRFREFFNVLVHLVRNSIEHGLESMEERIFLGKPLEGKLSIKAMVKNNNLVLCFTDDGCGIDTEKVIRKAIEKKIITENQSDSISKKEAIHMMFQTSSGVGLVAVQRNIKKLNGKLSVQTVIEKGTNFKITIPLIS